MGHLAKMKDEFESRQVKVVAVSPDTSELCGWKLICLCFVKAKSFLCPDIVVYL